MLLTTAKKPTEPALRKFKLGKKSFATLNKTCS